MNIFGIELEFMDLMDGAIYGAFSILAVGSWGVLISLASSLLWALGGAGFLGLNGWRRYGCPIILFAAYKWHNPSFWPYVGLAAAIGAFHLGYGVPSTMPPDAGSWLGRRFGSWTRVIWWWILILATSLMFWR